MHRSRFIVVAVFLAIPAISCSGNNTTPVMPDTDNPPILDDRDVSEALRTQILGYYDIYFDFDTASFESIANRTALFTLNIVPFLNQMTAPQNGITFDSIVIHDDDPEILGVDVEFSVYHPFPGYAQYEAYDLRGIVIGDGSNAMSYDNLYVAEHGADLWMKNPDGYTRWFNPTEFTSETIFGYYPGGWQNYEGNSHLNPYKYYSKHLGKDDNLWSYLTGDNNWDGIFESGIGRTMELEFPLPPDGIGLMFGYAVVVAWEDQGETGPYYPFHIPEAVACSVAQTPDVWFDGENSGGNLILDIDLFAWEHQPTFIKIESSLLDYIAEFDYGTCASEGGENYSTWHVEAPVSDFDSTDGHYYWVIAEYEDFDYSNDTTGLPYPESPLAAFFRFFDPEIIGEFPNEPPVCDLEIVEGTTGGWDVIGSDVEFDASGSYDPDGDVLTYHWDFDGDDIYDETPDDDYEGGPDQPVHTYLEDGIAKLWIEDPYGENAFCSVDVILTLYPSKNIPLRPTSQVDPAWAVDLALDHVNGNLYVLYNTGPIGLRTPEGFYQEEDETDWKIVSPMAIWIDVTGDQNVHVSFTGLYFKLYHYYPDGTEITYSSINLWGMEEQIAFGNGTGPYANDVFMTYGEEDYNVYSTTWFYHYDDTTYDYLGHTSHTVYYPDFFGCDRIKYQNISGIESDQDCEHIWICEGDDISRWSLDVPAGTVTQDGPCISEGGRDITRDNLNNIHVLDYPNKVKMFDSVTGDKIGEYGDNTSMAGGQARAIEGSDFNGNIFVVHGTPDDYYRLSIFFPEEMPE